MLYDTTSHLLLEMRQAEGEGCMICIGTAQLNRKSLVSGIRRPGLSFTASGLGCINQLSELQYPHEKQGQWNSYLRAL